MDFIKKLSIIGDQPFNENHKVFLLKNNKLIPCYIKKLPNSRVEVITAEETVSYPSYNVTEMGMVEKAKCFDLQNEITVSTYIVYDGEVKLELDITHVFDKCCNYYQISRDIAERKTRKREIVQVRQIAMRLTKELTRYSLAVIGVEIGGKDHATVLHACKTINNLMDVNPKINQEVKEIEMWLREHYKILK